MRNRGPEREVVYLALATQNQDPNPVLIHPKYLRDS